LTDNSSLLLSGSADNTIRVWAVAAPGNQQRLEPWRCIAVLEGHAAPVSSLACYPLNAEEGPLDHAAPFLVVSTAGDAHVHVWCCTPRCESVTATGGRQGEEDTTCPLASVESTHGQRSWELHQRLSVGTHLQQAAALTHLPMAPSWLILATGGTDRTVRLHVRAPGRDSRFVEVCRLLGHENWVRSLAFCHAIVDRGRSGAGQSAPPSSGCEVELLLASASQDRYGGVHLSDPTGVELSIPPCLPHA
jgi:WD40 repeat protein